MVGTRPTDVREADTRVGRLLSEARERQRVSLSRAASDLKIPERHLEALEEGRLSVFKAEVYARGAFNKYASYLGVETQSTQRAFQKVLSNSREAVPLKVHRPSSWLAARLTPRWILTGAVGSLALVVGGYVVWQVAAFVVLPRLAVETPAGIVETEIVAITGSVARHTSLTVNEEPVFVSEDGTFTFELPLQPGINIARVEATNAAGRSRIVQRDLLRSR